MTRRRVGRPRRGEVTTAVLVASALLLAGCTSKSAGPPKGTDVVPVLRIGIVRPASLDPAWARTIDEQLVADHLFDSLVAADPTTLDPLPSLAESWTATPDQMHWEFTLRAGALFSNGSPVTSADVKATLDRIAAKATESSVQDLLERVRGYAEVAVDGSADGLAGVTVISPEVVAIDLDSPWSVLPSVLSNPAFGVVPASQAGEAWPANAETLVTSGPFRVQAASEERLSLVPADGGTSGIDRLEVSYYDDRNSSFEALLSGRVDWSQIPPDRVAEATSRFGDDLYRPYVAELFYAMNLRSPKFADRRLREAITHAVDRAKIIESVYDGTVEPVSGLILDGLAGHRPDACGEPCRFDLDRARALVSEITASGAAIPEIGIDFEDDSTQSVVANVIRDSLLAAGIPAVLRPKPLADYQQFAVSGDQELFRLGWIPPYPSADAVLSPLFESTSPNNLTHFALAAVDQELQAARLDADPGGRLAKWQEAERLIFEDPPIVPVAQFVLHSAAAPTVTGLTVTATGTFDARQVTMMPARR